MVRREAREGLVVAAESQLSVALDVTITPELALEGTAREIVSVVQGLRRTTGLEVSDRITVGWQSSSDDIATAFNRYSELISGEVLATRLDRSDEPQGTPVEINGQQLSITIRRDYSGG